MSLSWWSSASAGPERTLNPLIHAKRGLVRTVEATQRLLQHLARVWAQAILLMMMASAWQSTHEMAASRMARGRWCLASLVFSRLHSLDELAMPTKVGCLDEVGPSPDNVAPVKKERSSRYKGLSWHKSVGKWSVQLRIQGKARSLKRWRAP